MTTRLLARIASWFEARPTPAAAVSPEASAWEQGNAAIADVTRWGWLPALSGVSVAADHAARAHRDTGGTAGRG
ncbi:hypothetical protein [Arthrobacter oryzae]|uniref:hypothetical protein n=1 Tax=Arthrobacter oryzae TaxID=409290 RepID=UPI0027814456|nr:hypothetical protein [Arthrobacter oryzae]MDQ0077076.1 hypothetical protein [Arthrobacter oryzae]